MAKPAKAKNDSNGKASGRRVIQPESHKQIDIVYTPRSYFSVSGKLREAKKTGKER
ncbi:MAG: hypothetical protein AB2784_05615 [Candidatus Thiodiazotropha endolucinida]